MSAAGFSIAQAAEARRELAPGLACFLAGSSEQGYKYSPEFYGSLLPFQPVGRPAPSGACHALTVRILASNSALPMPSAREAVPLPLAGDAEQ